MKKRIVSLMLAFVIVFGQAYCVSAEDTDTTSSTATSSSVEKKHKAGETGTYNRVSYVVNKDCKSVSITSCDKDVTWVRLTGKIDGMTITSISANAFADCQKLSTIVLGKDIIKIGNKAFYNTKLKYVTLPESVRYVGDKAFGKCSGLERITIYGYKGRKLILGNDIFDESDPVIYCGVGSGWVTYCLKEGISTVQNRKYWLNWKGVSSDSDEDEESPVTNARASNSESEEEYIPTTYDDYVHRVKRIKGTPLELKNKDLTYSVIEKDGGYYFERSGMFVSKSDYIILCNCVAYEYGANWVPEWEMALVAEVIFNIYSWGYDSLYSTIIYPNRFEGSEQYSSLDHFAPRVNDRVISAVNTYLSYPEYFEEGYTQFRGDGTWNYFW